MESLNDARQRRKETAEFEKTLADMVASAGRRPGEEFRQELLENSVSVPKAAAFTGASEQRIGRLIEGHKAVTFINSNRLLMPVWQLQKNEVTPIIPEALELVRVFRGNNIAILNTWVMISQAKLGHKSAQEVFQEGDHAEKQDVLILAKAVDLAGE